MRQVERLAYSGLIAATMALTACAHYTPQPIRADAFMQPSDRAADELTGAATFEALFKRVARRHPSVRAAAATLKASEADLKVAQQYPGVGLSLTAEYSRQADTNKPWLFGGALDLPVDVGGRRSGRITDADLNVLSARYDLADAVFSVRTKLATALATLQATGRLKGLTDENVQLKTAALEQATLRVQHGEDDASVLTPARNDLMAAQSARRDMEVRHAGALADLAALLGLPVAQVEALDLPDMAPNMADIETPLPSSLIAVRHDVSLYTRSDILKAVADYDRSENALRLEVAKQYPDVRIGPGYTWERGVSKYPFNLSLTLPPADLNRAGIAAAEHRRSAAGATLENVVATQYATEQQALAAYAASLALQAQIAAVDLPEAEAQTRRAENLKRLGEGTQSDLLTAKIARSDAAIRQEEARLAVVLARVQIEDVWRQPVSESEVQALTSLIQSMEISR